MLDNRLHIRSIVTEEIWGNIVRKRNMLIAQFLDETEDDKLRVTIPPPWMQIRKFYSTPTPNSNFGRPFFSIPTYDSDQIQFQNECMYFRKVYKQHQAYKNKDLVVDMLHQLKVNTSNKVNILTFLSTSRLQLQKKIFLSDSSFRLRLHGFRIFRISSILDSDSDSASILSTASKYWIK